MKEVETENISGSGVHSSHIPTLYKIHGVGMKEAETEIISSSRFISEPDISKIRHVIRYDKIQVRLRHIL